MNRPRLLMVARTRYPFPLRESAERKFGALRERFDLRVLATAADGKAQDDGVFKLVGRAPLLDGPLFYLRLPFRVRRLVRDHRPAAIVTQSPYEAALVRIGCPEAPLAVELHGDWRTATRLYGSPLRRVLAPLADRIGAWGIRHADAARTISSFTSELVRSEGVEPTGEFVAFVDVGVFAEAPRVPVPDDPRLIFVGVLERYKNLEGLAAAWRLVAARVPGAELHLVGDGTLTAVAEGLASEGVGVRWDRRLEPPALADAVDEARALVLPSASEGLPRIVIESFVRGRAVLGARAGGIPDIIEDGVNGLLVDPGDTEALAAAIERLLIENGLAGRLGDRAAESASRWTATPEEYADRMAALVEETAAARAQAARAGA
jgi:glycosyltransferase involved in cell wall biosynthesis